MECKDGDHALQFYHSSAKVFLIMVMTFLLSSILFSVSAQPARQVVIDQSMISTATVTDPDLIQFFLEAYLIPEESVTKIQFVDATGNGFGEEDLIKCFPSEKTYYLFPSDTAQKVMNQWEFTSNFQSVTQNVDPEVFERLEHNRAQNTILAALLKSVNWNYQDLPMKIFFERDSNAVVFDMWGYKSRALEYQPPPPPPKVPETTYDVLHVLRSDTLIVSDTTYYDQFYIYRSVSDTLFISEEDFRDRMNRDRTRYQPGLVPPEKAVPDSGKK